MDQVDEFLELAGKCLNCANPMCRKGCPISTNIPEFIKQIKQNNFEEAYNILQENNIMSDICSTVCPVEQQCKGKCVRGIKQEAVEINYLESYINNWAKENNVEYHINLNPLTNKKVAVIGSGPAGLACAVELRKQGIDVTIYEKEEQCGGILKYGIPDFRLSKDKVENLINKIRKMGIKFETNIEFGKDISLNNLREKGFKKVFLALGAQKQTNYKLTEEKVNDIYNSDEFLKEYNKGKKIENLGITIVIGGGNVALDSARTALKMGAKEVHILYRRNRELMPARECELEEALAEGVNITYQTKVISANTENNKIKEIECIKTEIIESKAIDIENSNYYIKADTVIFAIGAKADTNLLDNLQIEHEYGLICVDENYKTNIEGIYAGGDLVETKSSVCRAIATGKKAAKAILEAI